MVKKTPSGKKNDIGHYARYGPLERKRLRAVILDEWEEMREKVASGAEFVAHMLPLLKKKGFKAPDGKELTYPGVRFQILKAGIQFSKKAMGTEPALLRAVSTTDVPPMLESILTTEGLTEAQRLDLVKAFFKIK